VALLGAPLAVVLWPDAGSGQVTQVVADDVQRDALAADALRAAAALRTEERTSRDRTTSASPAPTTSAGTTSTSKPAATPAPVPSVTGKLWVKSQVNVRSGPSADTDRIGSLKALTKVGVTGTTKSGWTEVVVDDRAGWVRSTFLSKTKPAPQTKRAAAGVSNASCPISKSIEPHLSTNARAVYRAVCAEFGGPVKSFGGYRAGDSGDHGSGRAVDIMVSGDPGWDIARYVQAHAKEFGVTYVIYQQKIWLVGKPFSTWRAMEDRGSTTANHYDHVHVSVS
jgi:uncharacterized protein YraI